MTGGLAIVAEELGGPVDARLVDHVDRAASRHELDRLRARYREYVAGHPTLPPREGALRPYLPSRAVGDPRYAHGVGTGEYDLDDDGDVARVVQSLRHFLLYCDSVAVDNPLVLHLDKAGLTNPGLVALQRVGRDRLVRWLRVLAELRELVEAGVVCLVEPRYEIHNRLPDLLSRPDHDRLAEEADFSDFPGPPASRDGRWAQVVMAERAAASGLVAHGVHGGNVTVYVPYRHVAQVLDAAAAAQPGAAEMDRLREVLAVDVPTFAPLPVADMVAIRRHGAFEAFRAAVRRAVVTAQALDPTAPGYPDAVRQLVHDEVLAVADPAREASRSATLSGWRRAGRILAFVALPAALGAVGGPVGSVAGATGGAAAEQWWDRFSTRSPRAANDAFARHAALFRPDPEPG